ncbi:hypothetical protein CSOJ01_14680, partial [Colletotrichum sojae]
AVTSVPAAEQQQPLWIRDHPERKAGARSASCSAMGPWQPPSELSNHSTRISSLPGPGSSCRGGHGRDHQQLW